MTRSGLIDIARQIDAIPAAERVCEWHDDHDPDTGEPCGNKCGRPATHVILWRYPSTGETRWSFGCFEHTREPGIDPPGAHGWDYVAVEL